MSVNRWRNGLRVIGFLALLMVLAAGCSKKPTGPVTIKVASVKIANATPWYVAEKLGYFKEENLVVEHTLVAQGSVSLEALVGGSVQVAQPDNVALLLAAGNRDDLRILTMLTKTRPQAPDNNGLLVRKDSPIQSVKDLEGKKVSAALLNSVNHVYVMALLEKHGVDPKKVQFVELPFPNMADALERDQVQAVFNVEPFVTTMMDTGKFRVLAYPFIETQPAMSIVLAVTTQKWADQNKEAAKGFARALNRAVDYLNKATPEERARMISEYTGAKPELAAKMNLPNFNASVDAGDLQKTADLLLKQGILKQKVTATKLLWETAK